MLAVMRSEKIFRSHKLSSNFQQNIRNTRKSGILKTQLINQYRVIIISKAVSDTITLNFYQAFVIAPKRNAIAPTMLKSLDARQVKLI